MRLALDPPLVQTRHDHPPPPPRSSIPRHSVIHLISTVRPSPSAFEPATPDSFQHRTALPPLPLPPLPCPSRESHPSHPATRTVLSVSHPTRTDELSKSPVIVNEYASPPSPSLHLLPPRHDEMRESNFNFATQNRACVCVSSALYDRRGEFSSAWNEQGGWGRPLLSRSSLVASGAFYGCSCCYGL